MIMATEIGKEVDVNDLNVELHDGCKIANLRSGRLKPISIPLVASIYNFGQTGR